MRTIRISKRHDRLFAKTGWAAERCRMPLSMPGGGRISGRRMHKVTWLIHPQGIVRLQDLIEAITSEFRPRDGGHLLGGAA